MGRTLLIFTVIAICLPIAMSAQTTHHQPAVQVLKTLPIAFEENHGQVDPSVRFLAHAPNSGIFFTSDEVVLALYRTTANDAVATDVRLKWVGGNTSPRIAAEQALPGKVNYLVGKDPANWHTNLPTYSRVRYSAMYPGVDAVFYGKDGTIEYDLVVAPHADLKQIRFAFEGVRSLRLARNGDLLLALKDGEVRQHLPKVYQEINGKKRILAASYVINRDNTVGYRVEGVDSTRQLVIDPTLSYSTYLGSNTPDAVNGVSVDQFGRAYATGRTLSGFPTKNPAQGNKVGQDAFVTKFSATGGGIIYSTYLGGSSSDQGNAIAVDRFGNAYIGGQTDSADFPVTAGAFHPPLTTGEQGFVTKLSPSGSSFVYSLKLGGEEFSFIRALALDSQQRVYATGGTASEFFPVKNAFQPTYTSQPPSSGGVSAFVMRFNSAGSGLDYSTYLDGHIASAGLGIAVDSTFHAYVTGFTSSPDFPTTPGAFQRVFKSATIPGDPHDTPGATVFVTKFSADGRTLGYSTFLGGTGFDFSNGIAVDSFNRAYVTGVAQSKDFPVKAGGFQTTLKGPSDAFVTKFQADGRGLIYSTFLGGSGFDGATSIAVNGSGQAHVVGDTSSTNFPLHTPIQSTFRGMRDAFVTKLSAGGGALVYSTYLGGTQSDSANCVRLDSSGAAYVGGVTASSNFPTTAGAYSRTFKGGTTDGWVAKIKP